MNAADTATALFHSLVALHLATHHASALRFFRTYVGLLKHKFGVKRPTYLPTYPHAAASGRKTYLPTYLPTRSGGRKELPTYLPTYLPYIM
jgi:hypothetical protein